MTEHVKITLFDDDGCSESVWATPVVTPTGSKPTSTRLVRIDNITMSGSYCYKDVVEVDNVNRVVCLCKRTMYQGDLRYCGSDGQKVYANLFVHFEERGIEVERWAPGRAGVAVPLNKTLEEVYNATRWWSPLSGLVFFGAKGCEGRFRKHWESALTMLSANRRAEVKWAARPPAKTDVIVRLVPFLQKGCSPEQREIVLREIMAAARALKAKAWRKVVDNVEDYWIGFTRLRASQLTFGAVMDRFNKQGCPVMVVFDATAPDDEPYDERKEDEKRQEAEKKLLSMEECDARVKVFQAQQQELRRLAGEVQNTPL